MLHLMQTVVLEVIKQFMQGGVQGTQVVPPSAMKSGYEQVRQNDGSVELQVRQFED